MNIWARFVCLLRSIENLSFGKSETPSLFELGILLLEDIFQLIVRSGRSLGFTRKLESVALGETYRHQ